MVFASSKCDNPLRHSLDLEFGVVRFWDRWLEQLWIPWKGLRRSRPRGARLDRDKIRHLAYISSDTTHKYHSLITFLLVLHQFTFSLSHPKWLRRIRMVVVGNWRTVFASRMESTMCWTIASVLRTVNGNSSSEDRSEWPRSSRSIANSTSSPLDSFPESSYSSEESMLRTSSLSGGGGDAEVEGPGPEARLTFFFLLLLLLLRRVVREEDEAEEGEEVEVLGTSSDLSSSILTFLGLDFFARVVVVVDVLVLVGSRLEADVVVIVWGDEDKGSSNPASSRMMALILLNSGLVEWALSRVDQLPDDLPLPLISSRLSLFELWIRKISLN